MRLVPNAALLVLGLLGSVAVAGAESRPIDAQQLLIQTDGTKSKLVFTSRDPGFLFPDIGGPDDPTDRFVVIELFSQTEGYAMLYFLGSQQWKVKPGKFPTYTFDNRKDPEIGSVPMKAMLKQGKALKIMTTSTGLPLAMAQGAIGIRISTGMLRNCALFGPPTIKKDEAGRFKAIHAMTAVLADCSDASLGGPPVECGLTGPQCDGTCPSGERCVVNGPGGEFANCHCLPVGSTPCGSTGVPACGGDCPSGLVCSPGAPRFGDLGCYCMGPGECGAGGSVCPNGLTCVGSPQIGPLCYPIGCEQVGEPCGEGGLCQMVVISSLIGARPVCAVPLPCDASCGGYTCPSGEICNQDACSCSAP